jgi:hypothetical protein
VHAVAPIVLLEPARFACIQQTLASYPIVLNSHEAGENTYADDEMSAMETENDKSMK